MTEGHECDFAKYCIPRDSQGNSVLTGDNATDEDGNDGSFTCTGLEVFLIEGPDKEESEDEDLEEVVN